MSIVLEFRTPQGPEASSADIGTELTKGLRGLMEKGRQGRLADNPQNARTPVGMMPAHGRLTVIRGNQPPSDTRSWDHESSTSELPVNQLLTDSGNSG